LRSAQAKFNVQTKRRAHRRREYSAQTLKQDQLRANGAQGYGSGLAKSRKVQQRADVEGRDRTRRSRGNNWRPPWRYSAVDPR